MAIKFYYNKNNTEGNYPEAFEIEDGELRKNDKIVATTLNELYDTEVSTPNDKYYLGYDHIIDKWIPKKLSSNGVECSIIDHDLTINVGVGGDYSSLNECFEYLRNNCKVITENATVTINILNDLILETKTDISHPFGHRIQIEGNRHTITIKMESDYYELPYPNILKADFSNTHSAYITTDGTLWVCGYNNMGQLGVGDTKDRDTWTQVDGSWKDLFLNIQVSYFLRNDGSVWACGALNFDEGNINTILTKIYDGPFDRFSGKYAINDSTGNYEILNVNNDYKNDVSSKNILPQYISKENFILDTHNNLWVYGNNYYGQLGTGDNQNRWELTKYENSNIIKISNHYHSMIIKSDGTLWATGRNNYGQLGLGDNIDRNTWTQVGTDTDWKEISTSQYHSLAIKTDGTLWGTGWLYNYGMDPQTTFIQINSVSNVQKIYEYGKFILHDSKLKCIGSNSYKNFGLSNIDITFNYTITPSIYIYSDSTSINNVSLINSKLKKINNINITNLLDLRNKLSQYPKNVITEIKLFDISNSKILDQCNSITLHNSIDIQTFCLSLDNSYINIFNNYYFPIEYILVDNNSTLLLFTDFNDFIDNKKYYITIRNKSNVITDYYKKLLDSITILNSRLIENV